MIRFSRFDISKLDWCCRWCKWHQTVEVSLFHFPPKPCFSLEKTLKSTVMVIRTWNTDLVVVNVHTDDCIVHRTKSILWISRKSSLNGLSDSFKCFIIRISSNKGQFCIFWFLLVGNAWELTCTIGFVRKIDIQVQIYFWSCFEDTCSIGFIDGSCHDETSIG